MTPPLRPLLIRDIDEARAGMEAAAGLVPSVTLLIPEDGVISAGLGYWLAIADQLRGEWRGQDNAPRIDLIADCGADAAIAHAALKRGQRHVVFTGQEDAAQRLGDIAEQLGATLLASPPEALDLSGTDEIGPAVRAWLTSGT